MPCVPRSLTLLREVAGHAVPSPPCCLCQSLPKEGGQWQFCSQHSGMWPSAGEDDGACTLPGNVAQAQLRAGALEPDCLHADFSSTFVTL